MSKVDEAVECFCGGTTCSQAILATYGLDLGLSRDRAMRLSSAFAGGMRMGETCGAVAGAFMVLGLRHAGPDCDRLGGREAVYKAVTEFAARFKECHESILCRDLLGCDISTHEGMETAIEKNLFRDVCPRLVQSAAEILEEML